MVRGDQSGIFSDPAPCFISQEEESTLSVQERVRNINVLGEYFIFCFQSAYRESFDECCIFCSCLHQFLQERLAQLLADSLDVLESEDTLELFVAVCR